MESIKYQCIECGASMKSLYTDYKVGIIKISHCNKCGGVADKYVEYDPVIIFLDALLLKPQPYRHLLINTQFESHWRLALLLWVCDAFAKLVLEKSTMATSSESVHYTYLGLELYFNYIVAATELLGLLISVHIVFILRSIIQDKALKIHNSGGITKAIIVASLGRVISVPALLWGRPLSPAYVLLCQAFVMAATFQALRVVVAPGRNGSLWTAGAVAVGVLTQRIVSTEISTWFRHFLSSS